MSQVPETTAPLPLIAPLLKKVGMKITDFPLKKAAKEKITWLTCYDYPSARLIAETTLDCVLVGDSVAMAVHGHNSTIMATMEMMILHTEAVARGIGGQMIITDLPFLCHRGSQTDTVNNVKKLIQAGAQAIKIEGADPETCQTIAHLVTAGIPIIGHIGLTPQSILKLGGYKVQGRAKIDGLRLLEQAKALEAAGCSAIVIECVPEYVTKTITDAINIPTIGIGAGNVTDGQVLVWHDMLGLQNTHNLRFVKEFAPGRNLLIDAIGQYVDQVKKGEFPTLQHTF